MAPYASDKQRRFFHTITAKNAGIKPSTVQEFDQASKGMKLPEHVSKFKKLKKMFAGGESEDTDPTPIAPAKTPKATAAAPIAKNLPKKDAKPSTSTGSGDTTSPTHTNTETGGSSPGGASTGGVGSGIGGAGTGGAATGGASTGGAGTVTVTISGSSSTETSSGAGAKKGKGKDSKPAGPITLNISNVGGKTDAGNVASGDGPGSSGTGGKGDGSGGGGGGAAPDEPENYSTSGKDPVPNSKFSKTRKMLSGS
jgi:hypothetical protein